MRHTHIYELLHDLLVIPSVSHDIEQLHVCIDYIISEFEQIRQPYFLKKIVINKKPSLLVANFDVEKQKYADIVLNWHIDVVPVESADEFIPRREWEKLYARWAWDMKWWVAVMIQVMKDVINRWYKEKNILLMLTSDEEVGGYDGVWALLQQWRWWELILIPDGWAIDQIVTSQKGVYMMEVEASGASCHSSRPRLWENAIHNIVNYFTDIRTRLQDTQKVYFSDDHRGTSVNFNMIQWWSAINKVPNTTRAHFDIRFTEKYSLQEVRELCLSHMPSYNCNLIREISGEAVHISEQEPLFQKYLGCVRKHVPDVYTDREHGGSDGRFFAAQWSKVIIHKATDAHIHESWERVDLDSLDKLYDIYMDFIFG